MRGLPRIRFLPGLDRGPVESEARRIREEGPGPIRRIREKGSPFLNHLASRARGKQRERPLALYFTGTRRSAILTQRCHLEMPRRHPRLRYFRRARQNRVFTHILECAVRLNPGKSGPRRPHHRRPAILITILFCDRGAFQ